MSLTVTHAELNRTTLARQRLLARSHDDVEVVVRAVGGLQAQHADMPYVALHARRADQTIADLEGALTDRTLVKAAVMRSTLHLVPSVDWPLLDAVSAEQRLAA
ncbi:winged helix DNA-binding protein [Isoptericola variabilis J7]|nr:winged helix DNA-binding protein [Isoptericola variabilis J7]